jgi:hypothetical protein
LSAHLPRVVRFELSPSPLLAAAILGAHAAAAIALCTVVQGRAGVLLAIAVVALGAAAAWSRALLRSAGAVRAIEVGGDVPLFELAGGERLAARIGDRRYVARHVVALPLAKPLGRTLLVTADMLEAEEFRRLRLWARWNRLPSGRRTVAPAQLAS